MIDGSVCAYALTRHSILCLQKKKCIDVDEDTCQVFDPLNMLGASSWAFIGRFCAYEIITKISIACSYFDMVACCLKY